MVSRILCCFKDWFRFVEICSTPSAKAARRVGRQARQAMKSPHTSGRKGQARVAEEMVSKCVHLIIFIIIIFVTFPLS